MKLYGYWRSSAAYRVRIALAWKQRPFDAQSVNLLRGEQASPEYRALNPEGLVPTLADGEHVFGQSLAILEYLEERFPEPPLLPAEPAARARVRELALTVACDIHPLNNLGVLNFLREQLGVDEAGANTWYAHWIARGFVALEARAAATGGRYCAGDAVSLADVCLVPQMYNARRFKCDLDAYPTLCRIDAACRELPAFAAAAPEAQPDATA